MKTKAPLAAAAGLLALAALAADWPQWRGPNRDGVSTETGLLPKWPQGGPQLLWSYADAGAGYSGPAIVKGVLYSAGARGDSEYVFAIDLKEAKGKEVKEKWSVKIGP